MLNERIGCCNNFRRSECLLWKQPLPELHLGTAVLDRADVLLIGHFSRSNILRFHLRNEMENNPNFITLDSLKKKQVSMHSFQRKQS